MKSIEQECMEAGIEGAKIAIRKMIEYAELVGNKITHPEERHGAFQIIEALETFEKDFLKREEEELEK